MKVAHSKLKITLGLYNQFMKILVDTMKAMRIEEYTIKEVEQALDKFKVDIVNSLDDSVPLIESMGGPEVLREM